MRQLRARPPRLRPAVPALRRALGARCALLAALALLAGLCVCVTPAALAAPRAVGGPAGQLDGNLLDGTNNGAPIAGQTVTLMMQAGAAGRQVATTVTDAQGVFHFSGLATDQADLYVATAQYQGATYTTDPISLAGDPHPAPVTLLAYEATPSDAQIGVGRVVILLHEPDVAAGTITAAEVVTMVNAGGRTYVGSTAPANGKPMNLMRFALPAGAKDLVAQDGFGTAQLIQVDRGFATTAPLQPGQTQFSFAFAYPYDGTRSAFTYQAVYPTAQLVVLAPPDMTISAPGFTSLGQVSTAGGRVQVWQANALLPGKSASVGLSKLPVPGERSDFDPAALFVLAAILAALALGLVGYYVRRGGAPGPALSLAGPAGATGGELARAGTKAAAARREPGAEGEGTAPQALLQALVRLDCAREAGKVDEGAYRVQRDALKAELKARMRAEASPAATGTGAGEKR
jgi:Carboxypeptidase regulatory-like domain